MVKYKVGIHFDGDFLRSLKNNDNSGVELVKSTQHLGVHPIHLNDFSKSVKDILKERIARHDKNLNGILLGYENLRLKSNKGNIYNDSCYIHLDLEGDFFIFKPEEGKEMQGVVTRKTKDHVGLLVYNTFNVSIPRPMTDNDWLGNSVNIGSEVLFKITFINLTSFMPYIKGEIISVLSEGDGDDSNIDQKQKKTKKRKLSNLEDMVLPENYIFDQDSSTEITELNNKKSKKDKNEETSLALDDLDLAELLKLSKKLEEKEMKKKRKIKDREGDEVEISSKKRKSKSNHEIVDDSL